VLVVEDEPLVREVATSTLARQGYNMLVAGNGLDALRIVDQYALGDISPVVTDVVMPLMGGKELAERLAECHPAIRVILTSGYTDDQYFQTEVLGVRPAFVNRPFKPAELAREASEMLDQ
jgi:CheY-like chemotaxis protein